MKHANFMRDTFPSLDPEMQYCYLERIGILTDRKIEELPDKDMPDLIHELALKDCGLMLV